MADPLYPQQQRNYLDDILDQAFDDLEMERQRQESIINANDPDKVLSQLNKVDKQIENEPEEVQQAVRQKVYKPGYFDRNREMMDWKPQGKSVVEPKDNTKSIDETIQRYEQYEQLFPQYLQEEYDKVAQDLGQVKTSQDRDVIRGPFSEEPTYTEQDLETKAITQAKKRLSDEGILEPKRTFLGTLKETFTDYKKFGSKLPYLGGGVEAYEALDLLQSIKDIQRGTADQADYATVMNAQLEMERDSGFGAMVIDIMLQLPAYAVEFSTTAGTYTAGRKAGQKALQESVNWVLSKQGKKIIKEGADRFGLKAVKGVVGATTGTLARTVDPKMFSRVVANVSRELLPDYELNRKLDGKLEVLSSNEKSLGKSIVDGYLLTYLELLGEQSGEAIPFLGKEFKTFLKSKPESAVHGLLKSLIRKNPDVPPGKFMQGVRQAGIQSVPVELMEERFTDFLQSGVEGHEFEWPTAEEWLAEIVAIGGFSASVRGVGKGLDKRAEKKLEKAKAKGLEAIETGQLRQLTDQDISDFGRSLTKEEAMEIGIAQETGEVDPGSELGKEMIRRELDMEKFPETLRELREEEARKTIKEQKIEGEDFVGKLIEKAQSESGIAIEREYLDRTLADEIADEELSEERAKEILREHGIDEKTNPEEIMITGRTSGFVVRLSTAGTQERMAEEFVAVSEEMAEVYYNAEVENIGEQEFENEIAKDRKNYHEATGEQDTGESNKEWFSTMALRFATQGKVHKSIGAKLKQIFQDLMERAQILLQDAFRLQKHIKEGKVSDSLLKKLEEATDFKKVGEKVKQAKESKKQPTYRISELIDKKYDVPYGPVTVGIYENDKNNTLTINELVIDKSERDTGLGTQVMNDIIQYADSNGLKILLTPSTDFGGTSISRLKKFYKRFGFVENKGRNKDFSTRESMYRNPVSSSYRMSIAEGMEKLRTKPALRAPAKGVKLSKGQKKTRINRALNNTIKDIKKLEKNDPKAFTEAIGWYADDILKAINILSNETQFAKDHPVLFTTILAITSNGQKVPVNYNDTADLLVEFDKNGKLPVVDDVTTESGKPKKVLKIGDRVLGGVRNDTIGKHGDRLQFLIDKFGIEGAETWLTSEWTGREILQILEESGTGKTVAGLKITGTYKGMRIFGRKLGNFGLSFHDLTDEAVIDVWMTRWWNRQMGTPYLEDKSVAESPRNPQEFDLIVDAVQAITDEINKGSDTELSVASVQALIWYNEKDLYEKNDINVEKAVNYSEVANARNTTTKESKAQPSAQDAELKGSEEGTPGVSQEVQEGDQKTSYRLAPTFYSKAERVVTEQFPPTMKSQSVENFLKKNQVKPEEIQWLDLETLLKGKQKVTKEELQEWIQANKIEVEDVMLGESYTLNSEQSLTKDEFLKMFVDFEGNNTLDDGETLEFIEDGTFSDFKYLNEDNKEYVVYKDNELKHKKYTLRRMEVDEYSKSAFLGAIVDNKDSLNEIRQIIGSLSSDATKHSSFQLPGEKEDYRELLLTLPTRPMTFEEFDKDARSVGLTDKQIIKDRYIDYLQDPEGWYEGTFGKEDYSKADNFTTGHYDEPNILAHVRFNTRKSPTGERVLFIEELQSDWHTKGREKGYKKDPKKIEELQKELFETQTKRNILKDKPTLNPDITNAEIEKLNNKLSELREKLNDLGSTGVPDAPFKGNGWIELIMKRMLRYASENNFDRIAWTTANQQIDRWKNELRQNVDQISWQKTGSITSDFRLADSVIVNGLKKNESVFNQTIPIEGETTINGQKVTLEGLLGKQMATQIRNSEDRTGVIEGDDLTVGGQGFKVVYDFAIKKILNKMGKKFNAKVDQVELRKEFLKWDAETQELDKLITFTQPSIPVTRKMKESALKGQPTFRASKMTSSDDVLSSPSFKKWFKGSQVKDKDGKPLVVYHGTGYDFDTFNMGRLEAEEDEEGMLTDRLVSRSGDINTYLGSHFTDNVRVANDFAHGLYGSRQYAMGDKGTVYPVFLSIKNPKIFMMPGAELTLQDEILIQNIPYASELGSVFEMYEDHIEELIFIGEENEIGDFFRDVKNIDDLIELYDTDKIARRIINEYALGDQSDDFQVMFGEELALKYKESLIKEGFDGIIYRNDYEGGTGYIAFEPTQIKSVFNKGTFNPHDPRISFRMAPTNLVTPLAKIYQEQKGTKKSYTKKDFELDLVRLGYPEETLKTAMDLFGIIRIKQIETDEPTPIEKELKKIQDLHITRSNLKDRIKRAYRLGAVEKEKEINKLQKIVTNYARKNLPKGIYSKSEVTGLLAKVRDAKRARELATALERIDRIIDKVNKRSALAKWNKTVKKKAKVKKVNGVPKGQVGHIVQDIVNQINQVYKLSPVDVEEKIELKMEEIDQSGEPTDQQQLDLNVLITYGAMKHKTPEEITRATNQFDELVTAGRMQVIEDREAYKERMRDVSNQILDIITGGVGAQTQLGLQALGIEELGEFKEMLSEIDNRSQSLEYIFDKLSRLDKTSKPLESFINNYFMPQIRQAKLAEYNGMKEMIQLLKDKSAEIYGLDGSELRDRINQNNIDTITIEHHDGVKDDVKGPLRQMELTYNEAYKRWMELQDPTLERTFERMGYNIYKVRREIEEQLPKEVMDWAEWQLYEFYPMYYQRVNEVFRRRFYVNLPFNPVYSPIRRRIGSRGDEGDPTFDKRKTPFGSVQNGSLKSRVSNPEELMNMDGDTVMLQHITEMEHFIAYTDVMRELRTVFGNRNISRSIVDFHGKPVSRVLNKFLDDLARGGIDKSHSIGFLDFLRANFSRSVIGINPVVFLKQLSSIPAYISDMPFTDWTKGIFSLANPIEVKKMLKILGKSELLDMRYEAGMERDIALAMRRVKPGNRITGSDALNTIAYALTKFGDKTAIYLGGYPLYKYEYKKAIKAGKTKAEAEVIAMKKFESSTLRAQQSGEIEDLSDVQRGGSFAKLFTMFMTSPNQYYRMWMGGFRNIGGVKNLILLRSERGKWSENAKKMFVAQFLLPTLFTYISNGFEWDEEDQITSWLLFPLAGVMFFGQAIETIVQKLGGKSWGKAGEVSILDPFNDGAKAVGRMRQIALDKKDLDWENIWYITNNLLLAISKTLGLPYAGVKRSVFGTIKVLKEGSEKPIREAIGFKFDDNKKKKKKKKKPKVGGPVYAY